MKTILDKATRDELISRINTLTESSTPQWGKMTVYQMVKHCAMWDEMALGRVKYKQSLLGRIFGKMALKSMMKDEPIKRNLPTVPGFVIKDNGNLATEKAKWLKSMAEYAQFSNNDFMHPFFGRLNKEQTGILVYKHVDHHLRQFNS